MTTGLRWNGVKVSEGYLRYLVRIMLDEIEEHLESQ